MLLDTEVRLLVDHGSLNIQEFVDLEADAAMGSVLRYPLWQKITVHFAEHMAKRLGDWNVNFVLYYVLFAFTSYKFLNWFTVFTKIIREKLSVAARWHVRKVIST